MNTAEQIAAALADRGVRHAFGMPGGATLPLLAALESVGIDFVLVRNETSAGFMADAAHFLIDKSISYNIYYHYLNLDNSY